MCVLLREFCILGLAQRLDFLAFRSGLRTHEFLEARSREHKDTMDRFGSDISRCDPGICGHEDCCATMHFPGLVANGHTTFPVLEKENLVCAWVSVASDARPGRHVL